jgi:Ca2+-binding EF-hand superfamily protein
VRGIGESKRDFTALGISEEDVGKLYWIFCRIDTDGSRLIEIIELLMFLDVERTRFTRRIFSIFDDDKSGKIDFREFVLSICKSKESLAFPDWPHLTSSHG